MKLWFSRYELLPRAALGARAAAGKPRRGALLRIEVGGCDGFADCHPWTELGDAALEEQLRSAADSAPHGLISRSIALAAADREARRAGKSAFDGLSVPTSHWLCTDIAVLTSSSLNDAFNLGFRALKVKVGRHWSEEIAQLSALASDWPLGMKLRLDCNSSLSSTEFLQGLKALQATVRDQIEFVEDPCPWNEREWKLLADEGILLAYDRPTGGSANDTGAAVVIIKPAVQDAFAVAAQFSKARLALTSYLDHPFGQASAAFEAGRLARIEGQRILTCGLLSQNAFEPGEFSEALRASGPKFVPPEGTGFGFDDLLTRVKWERLA